MNDVNLAEVIKYIPPSGLDYQEWINVGMALKYEGYPWTVWDAWSQADKRYHSGECIKKWDSFNGSESPVTAGTIIQMAKDHGYNYLANVKVFDWDDEIGVDKFDDSFIEPEAIEEKKDDYESKAIDEIITFLDALFKPDEYVGYVMKSKLDEDGKYKPAERGSCSRTAGQLIEELKKVKKKHKYYQDAAVIVGEVFGDYDDQGGAWIRFNPLDGEGVTNNNVIEYRYALVESDKIDIGMQRAIIKKMQLPCVVLTYSGAKSLHGIVKIDAPNYDIYKKRVTELHKICDEYGLQVDTQNRNPSRMTRMPGIRRGENWQHIVDMNIGLESWEAWKEFIESEKDTLPEPEDLFTSENMNTELVPEVIEGILRQGRKMILTGASKAGKSFLLMELGIAVAMGGKWLSFQCYRNKVLYINFELAKDAFTDRLKAIINHLGIEPKSLSGMFDTLTLRGKAEKFRALMPKIAHKVKKNDYKFLIIDPIYKTLLGDENDAETVAEFCNSLDKLSAETGATIVFCHHHSKGAGAGTAAQNRSSGSGVFARDPDAIVDLLEIDNRDKDGDPLEVTIPDNEDLKLHDYAFFMRIESVLREFPPMKPTEIVFNYPVHYVVEGLEKARTSGADDTRTRQEKQEAGRTMQTARKEERINKLLEYIESITSFTGVNPTLEEAVKYFENKKGYSEENIKKWCRDESTGVKTKNGILFIKSNP